MRCLYDEDLDGFTLHVKSVDNDLSLLQNVKGTNILHDFANSSHSTFPYFLKSVNLLSPGLLSQMLGSKSAEKDNLTPLQLAIVFNKRVGTK